MLKTSLATSAIALTAITLSTSSNPEPMGLKEEVLYVEYTATSGEAVIVIEAESEATLERIEVRAPDGLPVVSMRAEGTPERTLSGFIVESHETRPDELFRTYAAGNYQFSGRTATGRPVFGNAALEHELLDPPTITYPRHGSELVPADDLLVEWLPDSEAVGYRVQLEQNNTDGLQVKLPAGTSSLAVPAGVMATGTETFLEISAIGRNGNRTVVEIEFTTR